MSLRSLGLVLATFVATSKLNAAGYTDRHRGTPPLEFDAYRSVVFDCADSATSEKAAQTVWSLFPEVRL